MVILHVVMITNFAICKPEITKSKILLKTAFLEGPFLPFDWNFFSTNQYRHSSVSAVLISTIFDFIISFYFSPL